MIKKIVALFFAWRLALFFFAWIGDRFLTFSPRFPYSEALLIPSKLPLFLWSFANFDGVHYITIAKTGYSAQFTQVFFPLFPWIIGQLSHLVGDNFTIVTGLIITNVSFLLSLIVFHKLLILDHKQNVSFWSICFLLAFPASFYFGSYYSESLFFLFTIASFYAARKKKWWLAGILGALASATRLVGIILLPALLWEWYKTKSKEKSIKVSLRVLAKQVITSPILYTIPIGLLSYCLYLYLKFGDALYFWHAQPVFGAQRSGSSIVLLPQVIYRYIKILTTVPVTVESFWIPFLELAITLITLTILYIAVKKGIRTSYIIFSFIAVLIPTFTGTLSSMPRYVLMAFPVYVVLATIENRGVKGILLVGMVALLAGLTILFTHGYWVS